MNAVSNSVERSRFTMSIVQDHPSESLRLRKALSTFVTGVTIVTTRDSTKHPRGLTANSFTSVSLEPPLLSVCIGRTAASFDAFRHCTLFCVNVLSESQRFASELFASKRQNKFERVKWHDSELDVPRIDGALAFFDCRSHGQYDVGDHMILIGQVENFDAFAGSPLLYGADGYIRLRMENTESLMTRM